MLLGTWEFMSSLLLERHHVAPTIQDDMESLVLVIIYHALRYLPNNKTKRISYILDTVFTHRVRLPSGEYWGGEARKYLFLYNDYIGDDFTLSSPPLRLWVEAAINAVKKWIEAERAKSKLVKAPTKLEMMIKERAAAKQGVLHPVSPAETEPTPPNNPPVLVKHHRLAEYFEYCLQKTDWPALEDDKPHDVLCSTI
ncbi:hypothetical protein C0992_001971 [Termitomyces sp. T32_za158]|nr:hypothetical protein C0992_001971 [Termitomyces sp. T32_za158]